MRWVFPEDAEYIPICLPAFSPDNCHREEDASAPPPSHHAHTDIYHLVQKPLWEQHKAAGSVYFPPTYEQDGFTHATADPSKLLGVANHFYKDVQADWLCLKMTRATLADAKITLKFEPPAPVGSTAPLTPELSGRLPPARGYSGCRDLPRGCCLNEGIFVPQWCCLNTVRVYTSPRASLGCSKALRQPTNQCTLSQPPLRPPCSPRLTPAPAPGTSLTPPSAHGLAPVHPLRRRVLPTHLRRHPCGGRRGGGGATGCAGRGRQLSLHRRPVLSGPLVC